VCSSINSCSAAIADTSCRSDSPLAEPFEAVLMQAHESQIMIQVSDTSIEGLKKRNRPSKSLSRSGQALSRLRKHARQKSFGYKP
jgi:hypothetical protein